MKSREIIGIALVILATLGIGTAIFAYERGRRPTLEILARAPEKGNFTPGEVQVPVGEEVRLRIRNVDTVSHGFAIPELEVFAGEIKAGHATIVEFTATETGRYDFYCTVWCSENHLQMRGVLEVVPK